MNVHYLSDSTAHLTPLPRQPRATGVISATIFHGHSGQPSPEPSGAGGNHVTGDTDD